MSHLAPTASTIHERIQRSRCRNTHSCAQDEHVSQHDVECPGYVEHIYPLAPPTS